MMARCEKIRPTIKETLKEDRKSRFKGLQTALCGPVVIEKWLRDQDKVR
jgi:hypothetical protein